MVGAGDDDQTRRRPRVVRLVRGRVATPALKTYPWMKIWQPANWESRSWELGRSLCL